MTVKRFHPQSWRNRAKKARLKATAAHDYDTKQLLLHIAGAYDALAREAESEIEPVAGVVISLKPRAATASGG